LQAQTITSLVQLSQNAHKDPPRNRHLADALLNAGSLQHRTIPLRLTRAENGNGLGMRVETVSRVTSRPVSAEVIGFHGKGRREIFIPDLAARPDWRRSPPFRIWKSRLIRLHKTNKYRLVVHGCAENRTMIRKVLNQASTASHAQLETPAR
jgi:hypothetical protein